MALKNIRPTSWTYTKRQACDTYHISQVIYHVSMEENGCGPTKIATMRFGRHQAARGGQAHLTNCEGQCGEDGEDHLVHRTGKESQLGQLSQIRSI